MIDPLKPIGLFTDIARKHDVQRTLWAAELMRLAGEVQGAQLVDEMPEIYQRLGRLRDSIRAEISESDAAQIKTLDWGEPVDMPTVNELRTALGDLYLAGFPMATACFNLSQPGHELRDTARKGLKICQVEWDTVAGRVRPFFRK